MENKTGCVIMASGLSKRFGGNKLMADFGGAPMILRALQATEDLFDRRVVVTRHADVAALCRSHGVPVVTHDLPYRSDTIRLGLEALGDVRCCLFCPGDQPLLRRETIEALLCAANGNQETIWRPEHDGIPGSPVLFPRWALDELYALPEGKGGAYLIQKYPERVRTIPVRDPYELMDADTPQALVMLLQHFRSANNV